MSGVQVSTLERVETDATESTDSEIQHAFCTGCYPDPKPGIPALCGAARTHGRPYRLLRKGMDLCVVCDDLADIPCKRCGQ